MKKAKEYAQEIIESLKSGKSVRDQVNTFADILTMLTVTEIGELKNMRRVTTDNGLAPIFKEQRNKWASIMRQVNEYKPDLLTFAEFDDSIIEIYPNIKDWYFKIIS